MAFRGSPWPQANSPMTQLGRAHFGSSATNRPQIHSIQLPYCGALPKFEEFMPRDAEEAQCREKRNTRDRYAEVAKQESERREDGL